ncbi:MAG: DUF427 domain-containing protein [Microbacteriaceae bacterium]
MKPKKNTRIEPRTGQESVWDYPRPPRIEHVTDHVIVELDGVVIAETRDAVRVLETSHPPAYYVPRTAFVDSVLQPAPGSSFCEYKGKANYLSVGRVDSAAWFYPEPSRGFEELADYVSLYPGRMSRVTVDGETVRPQEGDFYGGWITDKIVGPFKGAPGTWGW